MRLDVYLAETELIASNQGAILDEAQSLLKAGKTLSRLEQNGVLHAIQLLTENSIGKAKQLLKELSKPVPVSAYDAFTALAESGVITSDDVSVWNAAIGLRNRIVHDYMNIDINRVLDLVKKDEYRFLLSFLIDVKPSGHGS